MAKKAQAASIARGAAQAARAVAVAEYVGTSLADLMNRKDALIRQLGTVEQQIAAYGRRAGTTIAARLPGVTSKGGGKRKRAAAATAPKGNRKKKRALPPDEPMVAATTRASAAQAKGRAAQRARTSLRSGNR